MTLASLATAAKSAVEMSRLAQRSAEEALEAAKKASVQANAVLNAITSAVIKEENEKTIQKTCNNCKQKPCLHGKDLTESSYEDPTGLRVRSSGKSWPDDQKGRVGNIVSYKKTSQTNFLLVLWDSETIIYNYTFLSKGASKFVLECKSKIGNEDENNFEDSMNESNVEYFDADEDISEEDYIMLSSPHAEIINVGNSGECTLNENSVACSSCQLPECQNGKPVTRDNPISLGSRVKYCGKHDKRLDNGRVGVVKGIFKDHLFLNWEGSDETATGFISLEKEGILEAQFKYCCKKGKLQKTAIGSKMSSFERMIYFYRLQSISSSVVVHKENGDKHRIVFSASRDILLCGVGLQLKSSSTKINLNLSVKSDLNAGKWSKNVGNEVFKDISVTHESLNLKLPFVISSQETYMITLSFYGGESYLSKDGLKSVNAVIDDQNTVTFKFEDYKDDQITNVRQGVINKLYFRLT